MIKNVIFLIMFVFLASGCSIISVDSKEMTEDIYPSKSSKDQVVYLEEVNQPHKVIATVVVNTERNQRVSDVIEKMKYEAAILGGDAITDLRTDAGGIWKKLPVQKFVSNAYVRASFTASVVVFQ